MTVTIDGTTGVSLVQDGVVTAADLASGAITSGALPAGSVLQVVSTDFTPSGGVFDFNGTSLAQMTSASITPSSTSSKLLIMFNGCCRCIAGYNSSFYISIEDGSTRVTGMEEGVSSNSIFDATSVTYLHSPNTTNQVTINVKVKVYDGSDTYRFFGETSGDFRKTTLTLMEIAG